ncbi:hypothetical protein QYE76_032932 [Lolium multiflorum]|uniref:DDE Tnp4 domain-containing protein n=1 Tax=Lolium multiflorum TaxID=4521 RepID=A0AAD8VJU8_LOLMU|nr:hypothetical protein QYE76_032932 [Lolium multiflorum]
MLFFASAPTFPSEVRSGGGAPEGCRIWRRRHTHEQAGRGLRGGCAGHVRMRKTAVGSSLGHRQWRRPLLVCREVDSPLRCGDQAMASEDVHMADLDATSTDWSSSDSDDSDIDELLNDDETETMLLLCGMKQLEDRAKLMDQRKGSVMGRMCTPRNRALGHEQLMQDYFAESIKEKKDKALTRKEACFTKNQEACRKDIERAFGVLQAKFAIVRGPARFWDKETLVDIMTCCVILHNMIIEDERGLNLPCFYDNVGTRVQPERNPDRIEAFLAAHRGIENAETHHQLTQDLIDH